MRGWAKFLLVVVIAVLSMGGSFECHSSNHGHHHDDDGGTVIINT
jgi:hypothetical protein